MVYAPIMEHVVPFMVCMISFVVWMALYSEVELPLLGEQEAENVIAPSYGGEQGLENCTLENYKESTM